MFEQSVHRQLVAVHNIQDSWRKTCFLGQFSNKQRSRRVAFAGFEDERVSGSDRVRDHPQRDHRREVEWRDASNYTEWLTHGVHVDPRGSRFVVRTLEHLGNTTRIFDVLETTGDLAQGITCDLAVFGREPPSNLGLIGFEQIAEGVHQLDPASQAHVAPFLERRL